MLKYNSRVNGDRIKITSRTTAVSPTFEKTGLFPENLSERQAGKSKKLPGSKISMSVIVLLILIFANKHILSFGTSGVHTVAATQNSFALNANAPSQAGATSTSSPQVLGAQTSASTLSATTTTTTQPAPTQAPAAASEIIANLKVNNTPTGFLNVRSSPSINGNIIAKVYPGQIYGYTQSQNGWFEIKLSNGGAGWVDAQYVIAPYSKSTQIKTNSRSGDYDPAGEDGN